MKSVTIQRITEDCTEEKEIYELEDIDTLKYRLLGQSTGINMNHCVILGMKHKENFWHRVYGYKILKNEELEKMLLKEMRKFKPDVGSYITVYFYERLAKQRFMFVPKRLNIVERPELSNFPLNIMFSTTCITDDDTQTIERSIYDPDLSTYEQKDNMQNMKYYNNLNSDKKFRVVIAYDTLRKSWQGTKYCGDEVVGIADGIKWDMFFVHLTSMGVSTDITN